MWGIFAVNDINHPDVYTRRPHYYVLQQLFRFVKPSFKRIDSSTTLTDMTLSTFYDPPSKTIVITGMNDGNSAQTMEGALLNLPTVSTLKYYYTDASHNFVQDSDVTVARQKFSQAIPAKCVFTLVGKSGNQ
jgi:O-glycosyl hydrolase